MGLGVSYQNLKFSDDFAFCNILKENKSICIKLAELITERKISKIVELEDQKTIKETVGGKGVRFDVYRNCRR